MYPQHIHIRGMYPQYTHTPHTHTHTHTHKVCTHNTHGIYAQHTHKKHVQTQHRHVRTTYTYKRYVHIQACMHTHTHTHTARGAHNRRCISLQHKCVARLCVCVRSYVLNQSVKLCAALPKRNWLMSDPELRFSWWYQEMRATAGIEEVLLFL